MHHNRTKKNSINYLINNFNHIYLDKDITNNNSTQNKEYDKLTSYDKVNKRSKNSLIYYKGMMNN